MKEEDRVDLFVDGLKAKVKVEAWKIIDNSFDKCT